MIHIKFTLIFQKTHEYQTIFKLMILKSYKICNLNNRMNETNETNETNGIN
jgi:hypothetical protein